MQKSAKKLKEVNRKKEKHGGNIFSRQVLLKIYFHGD